MRVYKYTQLICPSLDEFGAEIYAPRDLSFLFYKSWGVGFSLWVLKLMGYIVFFVCWVLVDKNGTFRLSLYDFQCTCTRDWVFSIIIFPFMHSRESSRCVVLFLSDFQRHYCTGKNSKVDSAVHEGCTDLFFSLFFFYLSFGFESLGSSSFWSFKFKIFYFHEEVRPN